MTPRVKQFEPEADEPFSYEPGQYTHLRVDPEDLPAGVRSDDEGDDGIEDRKGDAVSDGDGE